MGLPHWHAFHHLQGKVIEVYLLPLGERIDYDLLGDFPVAFTADAAFTLLVLSEVGVREQHILTGISRLRLPAFLKFLFLYLLVDVSEELHPLGVICSEHKAHFFSIYQRLEDREIWKKLCRTALSECVFEQMKNPQLALHPLWQQFHRLLPV